MELPPHKPSPLSYDLTPDALLQLAEQQVETCRKSLEEICATVKPENSRFDNVLLPLALAENKLRAVAQYIALFNGVAPEADVRQAASEAVKLLTGHQTALYAREDVFALVQSVVRRGPSLDSESQRFLGKTYRSFLNGGLGLEPGPKRDRVKEIQLGIDECIRRFMNNLADHGHAIWLTKEELDGVPPTTVDGLESSADRSNFLLTFRGPDVTAIMKHAHSEETRKCVFIENNRVGKANVAVFKQCVLLRDELAHVLGYRNFVEYAFQDRMAESQESITEFLDGLQASVKQEAVHDMALLRSMKLEDMKTKGYCQDDDSVQIYVWDVNYFDEKLKKERYQVDQAAIAEYFPAEVSIRGMLDIFEELFGLVITEESVHEHPDLVWHPDVKLFSVRDNEAEGGAFNGYLYTDIYPRKGKYSHNANFNINPGYIDRQGNRHHVSTALVCNLSYPTASKPSLLQHRQLITLFHELGHGMHDLLSRTRYARFHGHEVARDFCEMPSQMLEHWCWMPDALQRMSRHYAYLSPELRKSWLDEHPQTNGVLPPENIPIEMVESLVRAKNVGSSLEHMRQIALAKFDLEVYGQDCAAATAAIDPSIIYNQMHAKVGLVPGPETLGQGFSWGHGHVKTNHFIWSNEACYYGYKYSQVFSADLFHAAFAKDPWSSETGRRYRHMVLEKGGSQNEMKTLRDFLGREPSLEAFQKELCL